MSDIDEEQQLTDRLNMLEKIYRVAPSATVVSLEDEKAVRQKQLDFIRHELEMIPPDTRGRRRIFVSGLDYINRDTRPSDLADLKNISQFRVAQNSKEGLEASLLVSTEADRLLTAEVHQLEEKEFYSLQMNLTTGEISLPGPAGADRRVVENTSPEGAKALSLINAIIARHLETGLMQSRSMLPVDPVSRRTHRQSIMSSEPPIVADDDDNSQPQKAIRDLIRTNILSPLQNRGQVSPNEQMDQHIADKTGASSPPVTSE